MRNRLTMAMISLAFTALALVTTGEGNLLISGTKFAGAYTGVQNQAVVGASSSPRTGTLRIHGHKGS